MRKPKGEEPMRFGILGTGVVGKTLAGRLDGMGHEVMVGTRDPEDTLSRTEPDQYGNPPLRDLAKGAPERAAGHV
jgi:predicted dinucleotide-binding enzyme